MPPLVHYDRFDFKDVDQPIHFEHNGHDLTLNRDAYYVCATCHQMWEWKPSYDCPKCHVFPGVWDDAFKRAEQVPGFKPLTKSQMSDAGYQTGKKLPAPVAAFDYSKNKSGYLLAYNPSDGIMKKTLSPDQKTALEYARHMAEKQPVICSVCNNPINEWTITRKTYLEDQARYDSYVCRFCEDKAEAIEWARGVFKKDNVIIIDSETTDLPGEIIELAGIDNKGNVLFNARIKPEGKIAPDAQAIHGISIEDLQDEPEFLHFYEDLRRLINGKRLIIYNADFDFPILQATCRRYGLEPFKPATVECAMHRYAQFFGQWSNHFDSYKWQPLDGGHSASGDCRATLQRLREMAEYRQEKGINP